MVVDTDMLDTDTDIHLMDLMEVTDMVDTVERDPLMPKPAQTHTTDIPHTPDTDSPDMPHTLMHQLPQQQAASNT